jgi:hypothetical protein
MFDKLMDETVAWIIETKDRLVQDFLANGRPPGVVEASPRQEYDNLITMKTTGDPAFGIDAKTRLLELMQQFGAPPASPFVPPAPMQ